MNQTSEQKSITSLFLNFAKHLVAYNAYLIICFCMGYLVLVSLIGLPGILLGYSHDNMICQKIKYNSMTRGDYLAVPFAEYSCKQGAGLLQPYASKFFKYLNEVPGEE